MKTQLSQLVHEVMSIIPAERPKSRADSINTQPMDHIESDGPLDSPPSVAFYHELPCIDQIDQLSEEVEVEVEERIEDEEDEEVDEDEDEEVK